MKKRSERRKHCARTGCSKVRTPPARLPPVTHTHTHTRTHTNRQDRLQYTAPLASAHCKNQNLFSKSKTADGRHIENDFSAIFQRHIFQLTQNWRDQAESHADTYSTTRIASFKHSRWRTAAIFEMIFLNISIVNCPIAHVISPFMIFAV